MMMSERTLSPVEVAQAAADSVLAYDGPHDDEALIAAVALVRELVRRLNNATRARTPVAVIDRVIGDVAVALQSMPQLLGQLSAELDQVAYDPQLGADGRAPGLNAVDLALGAASDLRMAAACLGQVATFVDRAGNSTSHLYEEDPGA